MYKRDQIRLVDIFADVDEPSKHIVRMFYSALYFAITFIFLNYIGYAIQALCAWYLGYTPYFSYEGVDPSLKDEAGWSTKRIIFVFLSGPLFAFVLSFISFYWYRGIDHKRSHLRQLYFWLSLNSFVYFYSFIITGLMAVGDFESFYFFRGFVAVFSWFEWKDAVVYGVLIAMAILFVFYARRYSKPILKTSYSTKLLKRTNGRAIVFLNSLVVPYLLGVIIIFIVTQSYDLVLFAVRICCYLIVFLIMFWGIINRRKKIGKVKKGGLTYISPLWFILSLAILYAIGYYWLGEQVGRP